MIWSVESEPLTHPEPPPAPEAFHPALRGPVPPAPSASPRPRGRRLLWAVAGFLASVLVLAGTGAAIGTAVERSQARAHALAPIRTVPQNPAGIRLLPGGASASTDAQSIADRVAPAVVDINTVVQGVTQNGEAAGTGMILTSAGEVLTNNHVVQGASSITVAIAGRSGTYKARVVGTDAADDVALIQLEGASDLPAVTIADSSTLSVGQRVIAIGNAFGRGGAPAVTEGTITALNQTITASDGPGSGSEQLADMIQTDASISPGDSGGPLVNESGQVVGMITAGSARGFRRATATSVGFAIPSSNAIDVVNLIRSGGGPSIILGQPAYLGVSVTDLDAATASRLGLPVSAGALVTGVVADSPAASIGLGRNSVITAVGGRGVDSAGSLGPAIRSHKPGERVEVTWYDASGRHTATATLVAGPAA